MLGLPSTTEVRRRIPKEAFYHRLDPDKRTKDEFVQLIERIEIVNSIKATTTNIADGQTVHEIDVLSIELKASKVPYRAIELIAKTNMHKLVFVLAPLGSVLIYRNSQFVEANIGSLVLYGDTLDESWNSMTSQLAYGDVECSDIDARLERDRKIAKLKAEIAEIDKKC